MKRFIYICLLTLALPCLADDNIIDEVIWIVGDEAILRSEVEEEGSAPEEERLRGQPLQLRGAREALRAGKGNAA